MSRIKDPTILFQYRSTVRFAGLLEGIKNFAISNSKESLFNFFDIENAVGLWLDQIGGYLNIPRPIITNPDVFIMDLSLMDGPDLMGETQSLAPDDVYKVYINSQILKRNSSFTLEDIINLLKTATGASTIYVYEKVKTLSIYLGVPNSDAKRIVSLINSLNPRWFGLPSGVALDEFRIFIIPEGSTFFIMDSSPMDNSNFLMI